MAQKKFWLTNNGIAAVLLVCVAIYFLLMEHSEHIFPFLPYLILLLCPLMHVFMHGGHGKEETHHGESKEDAYQRGLVEGKKHSSQHINTKE